MSTVTPERRGGLGCIFGHFFADPKLAPVQDVAGIRIIPPSTGDGGLTPFLK